MAANRNRRLAREVQDVQNDTHCGITLEPIGSDAFDKLDHFIGIFKGPGDTPFEGGTYKVDIRIPNEYPFQPPRMKFLTKIWHPNISSVTGAICLDTLGKAWSPILTLKSALISLQSLLCTPEPGDPQDAEVAAMMITNPEAFKKKAQEWTVKYAGATPTGEAGAEAEAAPRSEENVRKEQVLKQLREEREMMKGYPRRVVEHFTTLGFDIPTVVDALQNLQVGTNGGVDFPVTEEMTDMVLDHMVA